MGQSRKQDWIAFQLVLIAIEGRSEQGRPSTHGLCRAEVGRSEGQK